MSAHTFWDLNGELCTLAGVNALHVDTLLNARGLWHDHAEIVQAVTDSTKIGWKLFAWTHTQVTWAMVSQTLSEAATKLKGKAKISMTELVECRQGALQSLEAKLSRDDWPGARDVICKFRGLDLKLRVQSVQQELDVHLHGVLKERGVMTGKLAPLFAENELVHAYTCTDNVGDVDMDLLKPCAAARAVACELVPTDAVASGEKVLQALKEKEATLLAIDTSFTIEISMFENLLGRAGEVMMGDMLVGCLPKKPMEQKVDDCVANVRRILNGTVHRYCSKEVQGAARVCMELLSTVQLGRNPWLQLQGNVNHVIIDRFTKLLSNLCVHNRGSDSQPDWLIRMR